MDGGNMRDLKQELDDAKNTLVTLNHSIRRIIGRTDKQNNHETKRNEYVQKIDSRRGVKRRSNDAKSVFNRLSGPVRSADVESRPRLNSRVIRELPTRQEVVAAQGNDSESKARNKRIFGSLIGTLHKFCQEESRLKEKEEKKAQIEKKLEEQEIQERATLKKEREALFMDRKRKQMEIRMLEAKMNRVKDFEVRKSSMKHMRQNIMTKTKPHIYFHPKMFNKKTEKLLQETQKTIDVMIEEMENNLKKDLLEVENHFKNDTIDEDLENSGKDYEDNNEVKSKVLNDKLNLICQTSCGEGDSHRDITYTKTLNTATLSSMVVSLKCNDKNDIEKPQ